MNKVNFDYEQILFNLPHRSNNKNTYGHEYIYFFCETEPLVTNNPYYTPEYFEYLSLNFNILQPLIIPPNKCKNYNNWWGKLNHLENERILNDKRTYLSWRKELKIELNDFHHNGYIYLSPFSFSGIGNSLTDHNIERENMIILPYKQRLLDVGIVFHHQECSLHILKNSKVGVLEEALFFYSNEDLFKWSNLPDYAWSDFFSLVEQLKKLTEKYRAPKNQDPWGMDFFFYEEEGKIKIHFCECNYRRTFGHFFWALKQMLKKNELGIWSKKDIGGLHLDPFKNHQFIVHSLSQTLSQYKQRP